MIFGSAFGECEECENIGSGTFDERFNIGPGDGICGDMFGIGPGDGTTGDCGGNIPGVIGSDELRSFGEFKSDGPQSIDGPTGTFGTCELFERFGSVGSNGENC